MLASSATGCATLDFGLGPKVKPVEVVTKPLDRTPLAIDLPEPLKLDPLQWVVITPANQEEVFKKLEAEGSDLAVFALTPDGYQSLAVTIAGLRNLISTQRNIILKYKEYYEPAKDADKQKK